MQVNAIAVNDMAYYNLASDDKAKIVEVRTVYAYTPESRTYLCEAQPSYELHYLYTYLVLADGVEDEDGDLDQKYCYEPSDNTYMHACDSVFKTAKVCGEFEDMNEAREYLCSNCPF